MAIVRGGCPTAIWTDRVTQPQWAFVGLAFLVPGVLSPDLPDTVAHPAAYGDLATSVLALLAIATLRSRRGAIVVRVFNIVET